MTDLSDRSGVDTVPEADVPEKLISAGAEGRLAILVGAGVSLRSGLPSWADLVDALFAHAGSLDLSVSARGDLEEARAIGAGKPENARNLIHEADMLAEILGDDWVHNEVTSFIKNAKPTPSPAHRALARLAGRALFLTTNYDQLIEDAIETTIGRRPVVITPWDIAELGQRCRYPQAIFKLHGDLDRPETIVLTEKDYNRLSHETPGAWSERLKAIAQEYELLLVGYGYGDQDIGHVLGALRGAYEGRLPNAFWLTDVNLQSRSKASTHGLRPIWVKGYDEIVPWLERLVAAIERKKAEAPQARQIRALLEGVSDLLENNLQKAIDLFDGGKYEEAFIELERLENRASDLLAGQPDLVKAPRLRADQARLLINMAACRLNQQRKDECRELALRVDPADLLTRPAALGALAQALVQVGEVDRARRIIEDLPAGWEVDEKARTSIAVARNLVEIAAGNVPTEPAAPWIRTAAAWPLLEQGRLHDAVNYVKQSIEEARAQDEMEGRDLLMEANALNALSVCLERSVRENPPAAQPVPEGERAAVIAAIEDLLDIPDQPDLPEPTRKETRERRLAYFQLTNDDERFRATEEDGSVEEIEPARARAKRLMEEGRVDEALQALEDRRHPWLPIAMQSGLLGQFGEHVRALELLRHAIEQYPGRYDLEYGMALHLRSLGRLTEALPHAEIAYRALPGRGARLLLAECYLSAGGDAGGHDRGETARDLLEPFASSRWAEALQALAQARAASTRGGARASEVWRRFLEVVEPSGNNRALVLSHLSRALFHEGDRDGAAEQAEAAFDAGSDTLDPQTLGFCGQMMLYASPQPNDRSVRRVKDVARTLRHRFPGDPDAEQAYLILYLNLGTPPDLESADYEGLTRAGTLRSVPIDEAIELIRQSRELGGAAWRLYRLGRLSVEGLSEVTRTPLAPLIERLLQSRPAEQQFLSTPVDPMIDVPVVALEGTKLLLGELELLILEKLGLLDRLRQQLGAKGRLLVFSDVRRRIAEKATELALAGPEELLARRRGLYDTLRGRTEKVHWDADSLQSPDHDSAPILDDSRTEEPHRWIPTASILRWLMEQGEVDQALAERHLAVLQPGEPVTELPSRLVGRWYSLSRLRDLGALDAFIDHIEALFVTTADHRFMLREIEDAETQVKAARLARELHDWVSQGRAGGWVEVVQRPEEIQGLPPLRDPEQPTPFREDIAGTLSWYQFLEENSEVLLVTGDYLVSAVFWGGTPLDIFTLLAWTAESYHAMATRVRTLTGRRAGLVQLVQQLLGPGEEEKLLTLARLGYVHALNPTALLDHIRRFAALDRVEDATELARSVNRDGECQGKAIQGAGTREVSLGKRTEELLTRAEWAVHQRSHAGSAMAGLVIARLYAETIWSCWVEEKLPRAKPRWNDSERAQITRALLARVESMEKAGASGMLEHMLFLVGAAAVDHPRTAFVPVNGRKTLVLSEDTAPARLWMTVNDWSRGNRRRRAALDRALLDLLLTLDEMFERGLHAEPGLGALMLPLLARQQEPKQHVEPILLAVQALSANWPVKPLEQNAIEVPDENGQPISLTLEELPTRAARHFDEDVTSNLEVRNTHWSVLLDIGSSRPLAEEVSPEAVVLRTSAEKADLTIRLYQEAVGVMDGRLFQLLGKLRESPGDPHLRRKLARAGVRAPFRLVRQDPLWIAQWGQIGSVTNSGYPKSLEDLRLLLSEPDPAVLGDQGIRMPETFVDLFFGEEGSWSKRPDALSLASMASEVPGALSAVMVRSKIRVEENEYYTQVKAAIRRLQRPDDQPVARIAGDMVFLRAAAAWQPLVKLDRGPVDIREELLGLFESVVREEMSPHLHPDEPGKTNAVTRIRDETTSGSIAFRTAEPALLRLCAQVVGNLARSEPTAQESELIWLTWRLFQWLELQVRALPLSDRDVALQGLVAVAPPPRPSEQASTDILDPRRFDPTEMPHRLMGVIHALSLGEQAVLSLRGETKESWVAGDAKDRSAERPLNLSSPSLEALLVRVASRSLSSTERDLLVRWRQPGSALGWDAPCTVQELALAVLLRSNSSRLFDLDQEQRQRWFLRLPGGEGQEARLHRDTVTGLLGAVAKHGERLTPEERAQLGDVIPEMVSGDPNLADLGLLALTGLLRGGDRAVEPEIRRVLERDLLRPDLFMLLGFYLASLTFTTPEEIEKVFLSVVDLAQGAGADVPALAGALASAMLTGNRGSIPHMVEVLRRIAVRPPFNEDPRVRDMVSMLGLTGE